MALRLEGGTLIALGNLMATVWIEKDMEAQFVMVNAQPLWDAATGTKRFRARDALASVAKQERWDDLRTILDATITRAKKGVRDQRGSTGMTEGEAFDELAQALRRQGLDVSDNGDLVTVGFGEVAAKEEIGHFESLLRKMNFETTRNHFRQAMSALSREEWESANANTRAFLDSLCEEVVARLLRFKGVDRPKGGPARKYLQDSAFLDADEADLLRSFFKVLHGSGSHPGTSAQNDARRRVLMASSTGSYYIERLSAREEAERKKFFWMQEVAEEILGRVGSSSMLGEYQSIDFDIIQIEGETVVFETVESYSRAQMLTDAWFTEFEEALERGLMEFALVLTDRTVDAGAERLADAGDGVFMRSSTIAVVQMQREEARTAMTERIAKASDALGQAIIAKRTYEREMEAQGKRPVRVGKEVMFRQIEKLGGE